MKILREILWVIKNFAVISKFSKVAGVHSSSFYFFEESEGLAKGAESDRPFQKPG